MVYNEWKDTKEKLELLTLRRRCTLSDILRQATLEYTENHHEEIKTQRAINAHTGS
jgi:hypothetical protein